MNASEYTATFTVPASPEESFAAIVHPERWWSTSSSGDAGHVGSRWTYRVPGRHVAVFTVTDAEAARQVVWHVERSGEPHELDEWVGTDVVFEIRPIPGGSSITFTHRGLSPRLTCYDACTTGWDYHLDVGLRALLTSGEGAPISPENLDAVLRDLASR